MTDHTGQTFGHYCLTRLLGRGGFADVYLGEHMYLGTLAAIKVLNAQLTVDEVEQFRQEARTIAQLEYPHIIRVLDFGVDDSVPFLVMGYAPNGTLRQRYPRGTRLPLEKILYYVNDIAGALQYAHDQKLIHRDVKPENMLLGRNEEVLLSDFGLAVVAHSSSQERPGDVSGTVTYMAPEQARGKPRPASDQYALGIVVYEWLCGARPFEGSYQEIAVQHVLAPPPPLHRLQPTISPALEEVVLKALAKDPHERYPRVQDFARALEQAAQGEKSPTVIFPAPQLRPVGGAPDNTTSRHSSDTVYALAWSPDGRHIASGGLDRTVQVLGTTAGASTFTYHGHSGSISALAWSPDGHALASASLDKTIQVWNPSSGNRLSTYDGHAGMVYALAWSPDGKRIASTSGGGTDNTVQVWETATGQNIFTYHDPAYWSRALAWSPDGKYLAVGLWNEIQLWDIARKNKVATYRSHHSWVRAVAWSPDGRALASTCEEKTVHIWDPAKERLLLTHRGHTDWVVIVAWSPDGKHIASLSKDNNVHVWDAATGTTLATHRGHPASAYALLWLPDGKHVVSASSEGTIQFKLFSV
ncbi:MAG TPA: serine/threonine-protein kinase [Ktedonobacteraceae bacterium]|nr:serine/threonine-protein kinase [Ktedonobacteraceae bacterium]